MTDMARLQLRWTPDGDTKDSWMCFYELLLPLDKHDIRREGADGEKVRDCMVWEICKTRVGRTTVPCAKGFEAPFRDGAHAHWDSQKLRGIPIVCITPDGRVIPQPEPSNA